MLEKNLSNSFLTEPYSCQPLAKRIREVLNGKVGFYSVGLYPASLAYNCALQNEGFNILLAPRDGRELFGAFSDIDLSEMDKVIKNKIESMAISSPDKSGRYNTLEDLIIKCELVVLSSNSKHIINDVNLAKFLSHDLLRALAFMSRKQNYILRTDLALFAKWGLYNTLFTGQAKA